MSIAEPPKWLLNWLVEEDQKRRHASEAPVRPQQFDGKVSAWARAATDSELARLADAVAGTRNQTLVSVSFKLGQLVAGGEADTGEMRAALHAITAAWTGEQSKSIDTIKRCLAAGFAHPRQRPLRDVVWIEPTHTEARL